MTVDYSVLKDSIPVAQFASVLKDEPITVLSCLEIACHHALVGMKLPFPIGKITVRLAQYKPLTAMRNLKSNFVDKFVALRGNVVRVSNIKPLVTSMYFDCARCGNRVLRYFPDGKYNPPIGCEGKCKNKVFVPDRTSATTIDWQKIRIQEIVR